MLTPISTKIEDFKEKFPSYGTKVIEAGAEELESFISTALEQRDKEWRELVSSLEQPGTHINYAEDNWHAGYNNACYDIIAKSKENTNEIYG